MLSFLSTETVKNPLVASSSAGVVAAIETSTDVSLSVIVTVASLLVGLLLTVAPIGTPEFVPRVRVTVSSPSAMASGISSTGVVTDKLPAGITTLFAIVFISMPSVAVPESVRLTVRSIFSSLSTEIVNCPLVASSAACVVAAMLIKGSGSTPLVHSYAPISMVVF